MTCTLSAITQQCTQQRKSGGSHKNNKNNKCFLVSTFCSSINSTLRPFFFESRSSLCLNILLLNMPSPSVRSKLRQSRVFLEKTRCKLDFFFPLRKTFHSGNHTPVIPASSSPSRDDNYAFYEK